MVELSNAHEEGRAGRLTMNLRMAGTTHHAWPHEQVAWGRLAAFGLNGAFWALCLVAAWNNFAH